MIDTHVHVLDPSRFPYPEGTLGYRPTDDETGTAAALLDVVAAHAIDRAVIVAASVYGADNRSLVDAVRRQPSRLRFVASCDPGEPDALDRLADQPGLAGVRLNLADDGRWADRGLVAAALSAAEAVGVVVCLHASPATAAQVLGGGPPAHVVLDHLGRPDLEGGVDALAALSARPDTWLKISGGFRIAPRLWPEPDEAQRAAVAAFSDSRLVWGSDWPFIAVRGARPTYRDCVDWGRSLTRADLTANAAALFWGNA